MSLALALFGNRDHLFNCFKHVNDAAGFPLQSAVRKLPVQCQLSVHRHKSSEGQSVNSKGCLPHRTAFRSHSVKDAGELLAALQCKGHAV
jgi:hypothetical protein